MSLDISLYGPEQTVECVCECCDNKHTRVASDCLFDANITHNLSGMANEAGVYYALWRPAEFVAPASAIEIRRLEDAKDWVAADVIRKALPPATARALITQLQQGLADLKARPEHYEKLNPENGWGSYDGFVPWVERYLAACIENPDARVEARR